jgi:cytochrome bd-type quinol oxidase subunit 2
MKLSKLTLFLYSLLLYGCSIQPKIIPDSTGDSAMLLKIKSDIEKGKELQTGYGWILWYLPVLFLVCAWGYKEFFGKKHECPETDDREPPKTPKESLESLMTDKNESAEG